MSAGIPSWLIWLLVGALLAWDAAYYLPPVPDVGCGKCEVMLN